MTLTLYRLTYHSPVGELGIVADDHALCELSFAGGAAERGREVVWREGGSLVLEVRRQLKAYFDRDRTTFELPLAPQGTEFQRKVWRALETIGHGETVTYKQLAEKINQPKACRAVGLANSRNPIPIIIPCHRVIGSDGSLTGFGGGLERKQQLLDLECPLFQDRRRKRQDLEEIAPEKTYSVPSNPSDAELMQ